MSALQLGPRRAVHIDIAREPGDAPSELELADLEELDLLYRSLCTLLFNYVPQSGHPGGSISSGRFVQALLFSAMDYDMVRPDRDDADIVSYGAGHKALGLYALWALRNEIARIAAPELLPADPAEQLRLEDLLGFRRSPVTRTPLFVRLHAKALDGHPTPATPFVRLSTGASGVGTCASIGLALGARDTFGADAPRVHIVEGEAGMTPGRVAEALSAAATAGLNNVVLHVDWNQASIDSNHVCGDAAGPGDYVPWSPAELLALHDWNVIEVPEGMSFRQIVCAQRRAAALKSRQPTAIVYRTVKGWHYGIEGKASHGAGHKLCSPGFFEALAPLVAGSSAALPRCASGAERCAADPSGAVMEECFMEALRLVRASLEARGEMVERMAARLSASRKRLDERRRAPRANAPRVETVFAAAAADMPAELRLVPGKKATLRGELGRVLNHYNHASGGALFGAAADLLGSTSLSTVADGFPKGYYDAHANTEARLLSIGGICEDAMSGILCGLSSFGHHIGVGSSYAAFLAPLGHIASRLHAIGAQALKARTGAPYRPVILACAHAGLKTGEDGPTHADPQPLQLFQDNFPRGTMITLTPWDPQELWFLVSAALTRRPAIIAPFVTRPAETVLDRAALGLAPASAAAAGVYRLRDGTDGVVVLQGSAVAYAFLQHALPLCDKSAIHPRVYYVSSSELYDALPPAEQQRIFPDADGARAMGITDFTLPTMYRWVTSARGRANTLHPFAHGHYLGSGPGDRVLEEAGLDGASQLAAIKSFCGRQG